MSLVCGNKIIYELISCFIKNNPQIEENFKPNITYKHNKFKLYVYLSKQKHVLVSFLDHEMDKPEKKQ